MIAGGKEFAILHLQVALIGGNHQYLVFAAGIGFGEFDPVEIGFRRGVLAQGIFGREKGVVFGAIGDGFPGRIGYGFSFVVEEVE